VKQKVVYKIIRTISINKTIS